jgi:hypothetical protein
MRKIIYGLLCLLGDPRFLTYDGATGKWNLQEKALDSHLAKIHAAGAIGIRILPWEPWEMHPYGIKSQFQPYAALGSKYDLSKKNTYYKPIVRRAVEIAKKNGMKTWWCMFDNCQFGGTYKRWSPWVNNVQGITTVYEKKAWPYLRAFWEDCIALFAGLDVRYCWANEGNKPGMVDIVQNVIFPMIKKLTLDPKKMTYGATMEPAEYVNGVYLDTNDVQSKLKGMTEDAFDKATKLAIWREVHGIGGKGYPARPNQLDQAIVSWARKRNNGIRIWLSDDGVWDGDSLCDTEFYLGKLRRRPSATRWAEIVKATKGYGNDFTYEHLPKGTNDVCQVATIKAIHKAIYGS